MRIRLRHLIAPAFTLAAAAAFGCIWDKDTLKEEIAYTPTDFDLVTGQFAHHGEAYYTARLRRLELLAGRRDLERSEQNDLAAALVRLGQFHRAHGILEGLRRSDPGDYYAQSNLGVLEKKRGNFAAASMHIGAALKLKPEGHMGLGDWYLRSLRFGAALAASPGAVPTNNFLGEPYADTLASPGATAPLRPFDKKRHALLQKLARNDQSFADGFLLYGDSLASLGDQKIALAAYVRAAELGHPNRAALNDRVRRLLDSIAKPGDGSGRPPSREGKSAGLRWEQSKIAEAKKHIAAGASWLEKFQAIEEGLVESKGDTVTFAEVKAELAKAGVEKSKL